MELKSIRLNIIISLFGSLLTFNCTSQDNSIVSSLSLIGKHINEARNLENQLKSKPVQYQSLIFIESNFFPKADTINISPSPLIFLRKDDSFPICKEVLITYYFDEADSLIQLITFEWQPNSPGTPRYDLTSHHDYYRSYEAKYMALLDDFNMKLGTPYKLEKITTQQGKYLGKSLWKHEQFTIELNLVFTTEDQEGTQRIRVKMY